MILLYHIFRVLSIYFCGVLWEVTHPFSYFRFDPTMIILIPAVILTIYAQSKVQSNFAKYLRVPTQKGYTGVQVARRLLDQHGLQNIPIELSRGEKSLIQIISSSFTF